MWVLLPLALLLPGLLGLACNAPEPADDPRIRELWENPSACEAPAFSWLDDPSLGALLELSEVNTLDFSAVALEGLLRSVGLTIARPLLYDVRVYQMRYMTQDRGELVEATGILALPEPEPGEPLSLPLLAYLHGTCGFSDGCAASDGLLDPVAAAALASMGHVVVGPDYLGMRSLGEPSTMGHPYLIAEPTALASLDSLRAARHALRDERTPGVTSPRGALVLGGSQGGHAALALGWYWPYYAPDVEIVAMAASVPPADLVGQSILATQSILSATRNLAAMLGSYAQWYGVDLGEALQPPHDQQVLEHLSTSCGLGGILGDATHIDGVFTQGFLTDARNGFPSDGGRFTCIIRANSFLHSPLAPLAFPPTIFVLSELDSLVNTPVERASFDSLCGRGLPLEYLECEGVDHTEGALGSFAEQLEFLDARFRGEPWDPALRCARTAPVQCSGEVNLP